MKKKNNFNIIGLIVTILLYACGNTPAVTDVPLTPLSTSTLMLLPTLAISTLPDGVTPTYPPYYSPTPTDTATPSSTPDYAALGIPSPTPTPTFDYDGLSSFYLTPFTPMPTFTGFAPQTLTPTANVEDMLPNIEIRKGTPQLPPVSEVGSSTNQDNSEWLLAYIQSATDLMNYVDGNRELYLQYVESLEPAALKYSPDDWFLTEDFDNNGKAEWLVSFPFRAKFDESFHCGDMGPWYCGRVFFIFENVENMYRPIYIMLHPPYYEESGAEKVVFVNDLNNNGLLDIVFQTDICGSACSTRLRIGEWDGSKWSEFGISSEAAQVTFADLDGNGTTEISLKHSTGAASKYNSPYPFRKDLVDVYGWQNARYELVDQIYPLTGSMFATVFDIERALDYKNAELAFKRINPVMENLDQSCDRMKTYVGIQAMFAYSLQGDSNGMKSTLAKLEKYCDFPRNAYVPAAKILWLAYEKSHDPISACQAMEHFLWSEYTRENGRFEETFFIDWRPTNRPSCPSE